MKLRILEEQRFSCQACTNCCRNWHVKLLGEEIPRIRNLAWPQSDPLHGATVVTEHGGGMYVAHREDRSCIFLDRDSGRCRIHEQFGARQKPLGCQLYPYQLAPTFEGEVSVSVHGGCPSVRANRGEPVAEAEVDLRRYAEALSLPKTGFDEATRCLLERPQIEAVSEFWSALNGSFEPGQERALFLALLCEWLHDQPVSELSREELGRVFPKIQETVQRLEAEEVPEITGVYRLAFRGLLGMYLRRDEDVLDGAATRWERLWATTRLAWGGGELPSLGRNHPPGSMLSARLFDEEPTTSPPEAWEPFWRLVTGRITSMQFMGRAGGGRDFLQGLKALALMQPLTQAAAKMHAAGRDADPAHLAAEDIDFATAALWHVFGRMNLRRQRWIARVESKLVAPQVLPHVIRAV